LRVFDSSAGIARGLLCLQLLFHVFVWLVQCFDSIHRLPRVNEF
jgi:hypothetical protein